MPRTAEELTDVINDMTKPKAEAKKTPVLEFVCVDIETGEDEEGVESYKPEFKEPKTKTARSAAEKEQEWKENAALNALTAEVITISYYNSITDLFNIETTNNFTEKEMLENFWSTFQYCEIHNIKLVGFNIKKFDFPMLVRRSWKHRIKPLWNGNDKWSYKWILDLMELYQQGNYYDKSASISFDNLCQFLGIGMKTGSGKDYAKLLSNPKTHKEALSYVTSEIKYLKEATEIML